MSSDPVERPRPVFDPALQELDARAEELARRWAFALLAAHPLAEMTEVPLEEIARHGPALCASALRSLSSEEELTSFLAEDGGAPPGGPGPAALSALARDWDAGEAVGHVEALRRVLWEAVLGALRSPSPREVADLADRLGCVCAVLLAAALAERVPRGFHEHERGAARPGREQVLYRAPGEASGSSGAVLIDEFEEQPRVAPAGRERRAEPSSGRSREGDPPAVGTAPGARPWDIPLRGGAAATAERPQPGEDAVLRVSRGPLAPGEDLLP